MKFSLTQQMMLILVCCLVGQTGCDQAAIEPAEDVSSATEPESAFDLEGSAKRLADKGKQLAADLGEKAKDVLKPLEEKLSNLDGLKATPGKLKEEVNGLILMIENKFENLTLPESLSNAIGELKTQLVALKDYLTEKSDEAKIGEQIDSIMELVKTKLKM